MSTDTVQRFDQHAVLELMGHKKLAGHITEETIGGVSMLRIDVPATTKQPGYTKYFGSSAVYCITPCEERLALLAAEQLAGYESPLPVFIPKAAALPAGERARVFANDPEDDDSYGDEDEEDFR